MDMIRALTYMADIAFKENRKDGGLHCLDVLDKRNKLLDLWSYNNHRTYFEFYCKFKVPEKSMEVLKKMLDHIYHSLILNKIIYLL